jgi:3-phenylpropionate/cinnamic acid dioxygenase small subunit
MMDAENKLQIHELLSRAAYALDERDLGMLGDCFCVAARMELLIQGSAAAGPFEGREAIMGLMRSSMEAQTDKRRHVVSNVFFTVEAAGHAEAVSNLTLFATEGGVMRLISAGLYRDRLQIEAGSWRIASRRIELDLPY